ncbi:MAG: peptidylprolyl isomerase [Gammaproteobacteria bacterium]|nr:peptidylprolyl isomerase [Gammaproteobacteria bacterium]MDP2141565.1 peptidylprolyl isomerase [Gammaproteobacteria bacterium]MDP2346679.1 peptidylprolyl isomerase [Gammaproteobacteria bacterium]
MTIGNDCVVAFHYRLCAITDGEKSDWIEQSFGREPLLYLHGHANVISGLEAAMTGKKPGDKISITLEPHEAYGPRHPNSVQRVPIKHLHLKPGQKQVHIGEIVAIQTSRGVRNGLVVKAGRFNVDVDTNHPYAGRTLHYEVEVVGLRPASAEEVAHRHVHGPGGHHH